MEYAGYFSDMVPLKTIPTRPGEVAQGLSVLSGQSYAQVFQSH